MNIEKLRGVISTMRLQDKTEFVGGGLTLAAVDRPRVAGVTLCDGLLPYYAEEPSFLALGCTFSREICAAVAKARAIAAADDGYCFAGTAPCGLIRDPMRPDASGLFSEDCFVAGELLSGYASAGVLGFVFTDALGQGRYENRTVDARALYELYLYPLMKAGKYAAAVQLDGGYLNGDDVTVSRAYADSIKSYIPSCAPVITQYRAGLGAIPCVVDNGAYVLGADAAAKRDVALAVGKGMIAESKLSTGIERMLSVAVNAMEFYGNPYDRSADVSAAAELAVDSSVLLKNDGVLPASAKNITVFGDRAAFADGDKYALIPFKDAISRRGAFNVFLIADYENDGIDPSLVSVILGTAASSQTVVVLCGNCATELPFEKAVGAVLFCPYCPTVAGVVEMLRHTAPRGHLPFSWLASREAYPRNNKKYSPRGDFRYESVYGGYRLFNNYTSSVVYPFGHGMDYTSYDISKLNVESRGASLSVDFVIKNTGASAGTALCQVYVTAQGANVYGITKKLVAFRRVPLEKTENARVAFNINIGEMSVYDENNHTFVPVGGKYRVDVGLSSADIRASETVKIPFGSRANVGLSENFAPSYYSGEKERPFEPTAPEIERLLKVPFIKKPDEHPELALPSAATVKRVVKRSEKRVSPRVLPVVKYKAATTPDEYSDK